VHDKQVRRRRAVLGLLVGVSLILLTAYFGESPSSPLHAVQRGVVEVLSPVQEGASTVLKPARDVAGWFSDTFAAKSRADQLQRTVNALTAQLARAQAAQLQNRQLTKLVGLDNSLGIDAYHAVASHVISRDPTLWYATIEVDKGSDDGVRLNDPVIGDSGLVGRISTVDPTVSIVTLITDHSMAVAAQIQDSGGDTGVLVPAVGNPNQLLVQDLPQTGPFHETVGQQVVTAGFRTGQLQSLYPPGIPIGTISNASESKLLNTGEVEVDPAVDLRHLDAVQILTKPHGTKTERAQLP
jgi:rod shape-determining protein MreC